MRYYIKQMGQKDCGYTSVKMLFAHIYHNKDYLYYPVPNIDSATSLKDIFNYAKKRRCIFRSL